MRIVTAGDQPNQWTVFAPGRVFSTADTARIVDLVRNCPDHSRKALAREICALFDWHRPSGAPKVRECWELLWRLEDAGAIVLPALRHRSRAGRRTQPPRTPAGEPQEEISCSLAQLRPLRLELVATRAHPLFSELIDRYHYLGFATPFGSQLRYFVHSRDGKLLACLQFSSAAWRLAPRDRCIGWNNTARVANLPEVVQHSRFLILPWVRVPHLASHLLARCERVVVRDWQARYLRRPQLLETLVDPRFAATCYRAANWIDLGDTTGRGRMDRHTQRKGAAIKRIYIKPLSPNALDQLRRSKQ